MADTGVSARQLMSWQENLANSAHQREVADLKAAGLNPVLSAKYGGAQTPSGATDSFGASGSGSGGSAYSGVDVSGEGWFSGLIDSLPDNGSFRIGKLSIPYSTIKYLYNSLGSGDAVLAAINAVYGTNFESFEDFGNTLAEGLGIGYGDVVTPLKEGLTTGLEIANQNWLDQNKEWLQEGITSAFQKLSSWVNSRKPFTSFGFDEGKKDGYETRRAKASKNRSAR